MPDRPPNLDAAITAAQTACPNTWQGTIRRILIAAWPELSKPPAPSRDPASTTGGSATLATPPRTRHMHQLPPQPPRRGAGPCGFGRPQ